jgi:hypothetical protein
VGVSSRNLRVSLGRWITWHGSLRLRPSRATTRPATSVGEVFGTNRAEPGRLPSRDYPRLRAGGVFAGLWSRLLGMLTTILHPMLAAKDGQDFRNFMGAFLRFARKAWFNYVWATGMAIAPIVTLVAL